MKKILFITTAYILRNSSAAIRNNSLVKGLVDSGYEVDVCSIEWPTDLSSPFFEKEKNGNIHLDQLPNIMRIAKIKQSYTPKESNKWVARLRQTLKKLLFFPDECYEWRKVFKWDNLGQYDCLISSSDHKESHFVGLKVKNEMPTIPWIQIWGDPWSTDVNTLPCMKSLIAHYESKLLRKADKVVYVSNVTMREMQDRYPQYKNKMFNIPRGFYFEINTPLHDQSCIRIVYTGVLSYGRDPYVLLNALKKMNISPQKCIVEIYGNIPVDMQEQLEAYPYIKLHESVDFEYMQDILASASILLYLSNKKGSSQIPGKLFDYMGTNKPILCLVSDTSEPTSMFLKQYKRCLVLRNSESSIMSNWENIVGLSKNGFLPEDQFSPKTIASQVLELL